MTRARYQQVSVQDTPYYHCVSRCVRRAYLCGDDPVSGQNFDHRKQWLVVKIKHLAEQFSLDVCAYAIMKNHYHLVLHIDEPTAIEWPDEEVIKRWANLFPRNAALIETLRKNKTNRAARKQLAQYVSLWRERLTDISWFMRCLNEFIARQANREDKCSGRFWEGRFKSQALLDERALVTCMAYVDLNPVRAGLAESLANSDFTSIQERLIEQAKKSKSRSYKQSRLLTRRSSKHLIGRQSFSKQGTLQSLSALESFDNSLLPITRQGYFDLLDLTCKVLSLDSVDQGKVAQVLEGKQCMLSKLGISPEGWLKGVSSFHEYYSLAAGSESSLIRFHKSRIKKGVDLKFPNKWIRGVLSAKMLYGT